MLWERISLNGRNTTNSLKQSFIASFVDRVRVPLLYPPVLRVCKYWVVVQRHDVQHLQPLVHPGQLLQFVVVCFNPRLRSISFWSWLMAMLVLISRTRSLLLHRSRLIRFGNLACWNPVTDMSLLSARIKCFRQYRNTFLKSIFLSWLLRRFRVSR